uniref:Uncharacterized protein n=1 Tax=Anas platyrhynchos TaxID=8839 RepID=A0A8B9SYI0_ANAPL
TKVPREQMLAGALGLLLLAGPWGAVGTPVAPRDDLWVLRTPLHSQTKALGAICQRARPRSCCLQSAALFLRCHHTLKIFFSPRCGFHLHRWHFGRARPSLSAWCDTTAASLTFFFFAHLGASVSCAKVLRVSKPSPAPWGASSGTMQQE